MENLISVIVPLYNKQNYLGRCIESLERQTYKNIEIIIVNDGSTDNSLEIAKKYGAKNQAIKVIDQENGGPSKARNRGIEETKGDYICFVDADDYVNKRFIECLYFGIEKYNADISVVKDVRVNQTNRYRFNESAVGDDEKVEIYNRVDAMEQLFSGVKFGVGPCNKLFSRKTFFESGVRFPEDIYYSEDVPFVYETFERANKVVYIKRPCYAYTRCKNSQVRSKLTAKKLTTLKGMKFCTDSCEKEVPEALKYVVGWRTLVNFEMFYYSYRDRYFDYEVYKEVRSYIKNNVKCVTKGKRFPFTRRLLLPLGVIVLNGFYRMRFRKRLKECEVI